MNWYDRLATLLLFLIPLILVICVWMWACPVGFWQVIVMVIVSIVLYVIFFIAVLMLAVIIREIK